MDFFVDSEQEPQFTNETRDPYSCRTWLRVNPSNVDLKPGEQLLVRYTFRIPKEVLAGTYFCAATFTTEPIPDGQQMGLFMNVRVITSFYLTVGHPTPRGEIRRIYVEPTAAQTTSKRLICEVANTGAFVWRPNGSLSILDTGGQVLTAIPFRAMPVLPSRHQRFLFPLEEEIPRDAQVRVRMDIGTGEIQEATVRAETLIAKH